MTRKVEEKKQEKEIIEEAVKWGRPQLTLTTDYKLLNGIIYFFTGMFKGGGQAVNIVDCSGCFINFPPTLDSSCRPRTGFTKFIRVLPAQCQHNFLLEPSSMNIIFLNPYPLYIMYQC